MVAKKLMARFFFLISAMFFIQSISLPTFAAISKSPSPIKEFKFRAHSVDFNVAVAAETYEKAFEIAAMKCMDRVASAFGDETEEQQMDIIDACANPVVD